MRALVALFVALVVACTTTAPAPTTAASIAPVATRTQAAGATETPRLPRSCENISYQAGDPLPIVPTRRLGQHLQIALDAVRPAPDGGNRWFVRFFVPESAPGPAAVGTRASVTGPDGPLQTGSYVAGPPNAGTSPVTQPLVIQPCQESAPSGLLRGTVVVGVQTTAVRSGTYTLTWSDIGLPEGGSPRTETWTVTLTCELDPGPARPQSTVCK